MIGTSMGLCGTIGKEIGLNEKELESNEPSDGDKMGNLTDEHIGFNTN